MKKWVNGLAICVAIAACFGTGVTGHADEPTDGNLGEEVVSTRTSTTEPEPINSSTATETTAQTESTAESTSSTSGSETGETSETSTETSMSNSETTSTSTTTSQTTAHETTTSKSGTTVTKPHQTGTVTKVTQASGNGENGKLSGTTVKGNGKNGTLKDENKEPMNTGDYLLRTIVPVAITSAGVALISIRKKKSEKPSEPSETTSEA